MNVRRQWKRLVWLGAVVCGMAMAPASRAALVYEYVPDKGTYTVNAGDFVTVLIYLKETVTAPSTSLISGDGNMLGAGVAVSRSTVGLPSGPAGFVADSTGVKPNTVDFSGGPGGITGANGQGSPTVSDVSFSEAVGPGVAPVGLNNTGGGQAPAVSNEVYLGSVKIAAGTVQGTTTFALRVHDTTFFGNTLTNNNFYDLDVTNNGGSTPVYTGASQKSNTFTVFTQVPEPTGLSLFVGIAAIGLFRRSRS